MYFVQCVMRVDYHLPMYFGLLCVYVCMHCVYSYVLYGLCVPSVLYVVCAQFCVYSNTVPTVNSLKYCMHCEFTQVLYALCVLLNTVSLVCSFKYCMHCEFTQVLYAL